MRKERFNKGWFIGSCLIGVCIVVSIFAGCRSQGSIKTIADKPVTSLNEPVMTESGLVSGVYNEDNSVQKFMGIPFAAPPVGELRWKDPRPSEPWEGIRRADTAGSISRQDEDPAKALAGYFPESEDCLYLNVYTPARTSGDKLPVIVYIHGGGFVMGAGSLFDGEPIARQGVVMVTINYRLGVFGFFAHPDLTKESELHSSGNYGILDQIAALRWVGKNIDAFGGDPDNVTLCGQSAGAVSISVLSVSPLAKGLFHRIILESGTGFGTSPLCFSTLEESEKLGIAFMKTKGSASLDDLRRLPTDEVAAGLGKYWPNIDGSILPGDILDLFEQGKQNNVTVLLGSNRDELGPVPVTSLSFAEELKNEFGVFADKALEIYPSSSDEQAMASVMLKNADITFGWPMFRLAELASQKSDIYLYYFDRVPPGTPYCLHSAEVNYALGSLYSWMQWEDIDHKLSNAMVSYWTNFARSGDPNGDGLPQWGKFNTDEQQIMELGDNIGMIVNPRIQSMEFLNIFSAAQR
jgi:para-nitrobenzyl esterase